MGFLEDAKTDAQRAKDAADAKARVEATTGYRTEDLALPLGGQAKPAVKPPVTIPATKTPAVTSKALPVLEQKTASSSSPSVDAAKKMIEDAQRAEAERLAEVAKANEVKSPIKTDTSDFQLEDTPVSLNTTTPVVDKVAETAQMPAADVKASLKEAKKEPGFGEWLQGALKTGGDVIGTLAKVAQAYAAGASGHPELASYNVERAQKNIDTQNEQQAQQIKNQNDQALATQELAKEQQKTNAAHAAAALQLQRLQLDRDYENRVAQLAQDKSLTDAQRALQKEQFDKQYQLTVKQNELQLAQLQRSLTNTATSNYDTRFGK
jgi:hypothetical protein